MSNNIYYVYTLTNPLNNQIFYVGKGKNNRYKDHFKSHSLRNNNCKNNIIKKLFSLELEPIIKFSFKNLEEEIAYDKEKELIKKMEHII